MKIKTVVVLSVLLALVTAGPCLAKGLQMLPDNELDKTYAQGLTFVIDANSFMGGVTSFTTPPPEGYSPVTFNVGGGNTVDLSRSILLAGAAQQGAFGTVNAVGSAVNMPINLVVLINSTANGGINISNVLSAINAAP